MGRLAPRRRLRFALRRYPAPVTGPSRRPSTFPAGSLNHAPQLGPNWAMKSTVFGVSYSSNVTLREVRSRTTASMSTTSRCNTEDRLPDTLEQDPRPYPARSRDTFDDLDIVPVAGEEQRRRRTGGPEADDRDLHNAAGNVLLIRTKNSAARWPGPRSLVERYSSIERVNVQA